jgi:NAD(P)H-flavin reductase
LTPSRRWFDARVTRAWWESETLRGLAFTSAEVTARHRAPGQYVRVQHADDENPYALASEPGARELELLFKVDTPLTAGMASLVPGDVLAVTEPEGAGFPLATHEGRDLILIAAGTGIAPLRAVIHVLLRARARHGAVTLFYGHRELSHFAYRGEWDGWRAAGIEIVPVLSGDGGRVQDAVAARRLPLGNAVAYIAGMRAMITECRAALVEAGLPDDRVYLNF